MIRPTSLAESSPGLTLRALSLRFFQSAPPDSRSEAERTISSSTRRHCREPRPSSRSFVAASMSCRRTVTIIASDMLRCSFRAVVDRLVLIVGHQFGHGAVLKITRERDADRTSVRLLNFKVAAVIVASC